MAKLKFSIHPLFFVCGVYFALKGQIFVFLTYTAAAVIHETGHSIAAARLGYKLNRIVLMPYGAVIHGDVKGLKFRDEIKVALAGPAINLACAVFFAALWWFIPDTYAYTDLAMTASLSLCVINLLPCAPLDGGRVLRAFLSIYIKPSVAEIVLKITGVLFSCVLGGLFVFSCFNKINLTLLFFTLFTIFGTFFTNKENVYVKLYQNTFASSLQRGASIKRIAVSTETTVKKLISLLDSECLNEVSVYSPQGKLLRVIPPERVIQLASGNTLYCKMGQIYLNY